MDELKVASGTAGRTATGTDRPAVETELRVQFAARSAIGLVRERNEDRVGWLQRGGAARITPADEASFAPTRLASQEPVYFAIADGLGAYGGGDVAAGLAVSVCLDHAATTGQSGIPSLLRGAVSLANQAVFDAAMTGAAGGSRKMQSTITALALAGSEVVVAHVGDCRAYRRRGDGLHILTTDHSQVMELLRVRLISPEQALTHPARYALTRSLGGDITVRIDVRTERLLAGDTFLLCSDGLWSNVPAGEISAALELGPAEACDRLIDVALSNGGDDNASAMVIHVSQPGVKPASANGGWRRFFG